LSFDQTSQLRLETSLIVVIKHRNNVNYSKYLKTTLSPRLDPIRH